MNDDIGGTAGHDWQGPRLWAAEERERQAVCAERVPGTCRSRLPIRRHEQRRVDSMRHVRRRIFVMPGQKIGGESPPQQRWIFKRPVKGQPR